MCIALYSEHILGQVSAPVPNSFEKLFKNLGSESQYYNVADGIMFYVALCNKIKQRRIRLTTRKNVIFTK